jgi:hypothetical protein
MTHPAEEEEIVIPSSPVEGIRDAVNGVIDNPGKAVFDGQ